MTKRSVSEALFWASSYLKTHEQEAEIARILMCHHTGWSRAKLYSESRAHLAADVDEAFSRDVLRASTGVPVQHITCREMFAGRHYQVNRSVLIPRPETEELVEAIFTALSTEQSTMLSTIGDNGFPVADIGTGSGILAITLALDLPERFKTWTGKDVSVCVTATDISEEALFVAKQNAHTHQAAVTFLAGSFLTPLKESGIRPRLLVSNPPYIPDQDKAVMKENVTGHEPHLALFAGEDGLEAYRQIIRELPDVLHPKGTLLALEIGYNQGDAVSDLLKETLINSSPEVISDINGNERIVIAWLR
ncbi:protein-(glutamine-N5) methyltransferase [Salisediminibacterium beveridgei]|uniref:peptide chain release factor N(5)-glutamine methyltransferase n=2 Tax=Salisediminibacterium beveridgei TaxID=632773 RepID=A0A1D7QRC8_9BACI|nr:protein-(glutamine-N5) methyltransferase [Salisediminibacterium beveridgei]